MRLCFGTFASILNSCRWRISQASFISKIINIIDSNSRYTGEKMAGDGPAITKLLSCKIDFVLSGGETMNMPEQSIVATQLEKQVSPFIDEDMKSKVVIALLDIIRRDKCIDFEKKESFQKYLGLEKQQLLQQSEFVFSDFLAKILLYTIGGNVSNRVGSQSVKEITVNYINTISKPYLYEYKWNSSTHTVTLLYIKMFLIFNDAMTNNKIVDFITKIDPDYRMSYSWVETCNIFLNDTREKVWIPFARDPLGWTVKKIQEFAQTLDDYTNYLGLNMRHSATHYDIFIPKYPDEQSKQAIEFSNTVRDYRHQLISIYAELYEHMPFFKPD